MCDAYKNAYVKNMMMIREKIIERDEGTLCDPRTAFHWYAAVSQPPFPAPLSQPLSIFSVLMVILINLIVFLFLR